MEWFWNVLGATLGFGIGAVVVVGVGYGVVMIGRALITITKAAISALDRIAAHKETVIEEYDDYSRMTRTIYSYPTPDRVRLAREGKPGQRPHLDEVRRRGVA